MITEQDFTRVNNDVYGNPRYVIHFRQCEPKHWKDYEVSLVNRYNATCKLMNRIGGRKFHNKQYGCGIVFQSYSLLETISSINRIINEVK